MNFQQRCRKNRRKTFEYLLLKTKGREQRAEENNQTTTKVRISPSAFALVYISPNFLASGSQ